MSCLVGTPKGKLTALEKDLLERPWETVRADVQVKLLPPDGEVQVLARSAGRVDKERALRRKKLRRLRARLHELSRIHAVEKSWPHAKGAKGAKGSEFLL